MPSNYKFDKPSTFDDCRKYEREAKRQAAALSPQPLSIFSAQTSPIEDSDEDLSPIPTGRKRLRKARSPRVTSRALKCNVPPTPQPRRSYSSTNLNNQNESDYSEKLDIEDPDTLTEHESDNGESDGEDEDRKLEEREALNSQSIVEIRGRKVNLDDDVLRYRNKTVATLRVRNLAKNLFNRGLGTAEAAALEGAEKTALANEDPRAVLLALWERAQDAKAAHILFVGARTWVDSKTGDNGRSAFSIDGTLYQLGDYVIVRAPSSMFADAPKVESPNKVQSSRRDLDYPLFARIVDICDPENGAKSCHLQLLIHGGSCEMLSELAGARELFLTSDCADFPISNILGPVEVDLVGTGTNDPGSIDGEAKYRGTNRFFCRQHYDGFTKKFTDLPDWEDIGRPSESGRKHCHSCQAQEKDIEFEKVKILGEIGRNQSIQGFEQYGISYRLKDFVNIVPNKKEMRGNPYEIGQVTKMSIVCDGRHFKAQQRKLSSLDIIIKLEVRLLVRRDENNMGWWDDISAQYRSAKRDNRRLYISTKYKSIYSTYLEGKCQVRHLDDITIAGLNEYKDGDEYNFWVDQEEVENPLGKFSLRDIGAHEIEQSEETEAEMRARNRDREEFMAQFKPFDTMELFSGIGGLCPLGMNAKWAVEFAPAAARTYQRNYPGVIVYNEDGNDCLARAEGLVIPDQRDVMGNPVKPMPKRGEVPGMTAGIPCEGYSGTNYCPKADDIKNTLVTMLLSFIDHYRPKYVLLENVTGILRHKLGAEQHSKNRTKGGIPKGTMKFIFRLLTDMGYQCEYSVLQCGEYELPQSRQRVFIWASLQGNPLPKFPEAICKFKGAVPSSPHRTRCGAPHAQITIGEAITDLPAFDWANPRNLNPYTAVDWLETIEMRIRAKKIPQVHITQDLLYAGNDRQPYASDPLTEYQRRIRKGASKIVHNHVTPAWYDHPTIGKSKSGDQALRYAKTEQICSIPMLPGADHRDLPKTLKSWWMYHKNSAAKRNKFYPGRFGRLSYEESFGVCLADIDPGGKNGKILHPSQHRVISIREQARAMGFPDSFVWDIQDGNKYIYRMLGNAVPVPVAQALGRELLEVQFQKWLKERDAKDESVDIEDSF